MAPGRAGIGGQPRRGRHHGTSGGSRRAGALSTRSAGEHPPSSTTAPPANGTARASAGYRISSAASADAERERPATPSSVQTQEVAGTHDDGQTPETRLLGAVDAPRGSSAASGAATAASSPPSSRAHMPRNDAAAPSQVCPGIRIQAIDIVQPPGIGMSAIAAWPRHRGAPERLVPRRAGGEHAAPETPQKARAAQRLSYSSWRRHQSPLSLRPRGARSSHWYMPHRPSSPRA